MSNAVDQVLPGAGAESAVVQPLSGTAVLARVRDFVDETPEPAQVDPLGLLLRALRGRELRAAVCAAITGLVLAVLVVLMLNPVYQSSGLIRVLAREEKILYADADDSRLRLYDAFVTAEMNILRSRPVLEDGLLRLRERGLELPLPLDVGEFSGLFELKNNKGLVSVAARSASPELSMAAVNALLDAYEASNREHHSRQYLVRESELSGRARALQGRLDTLDARYLEIGGEHDVSTLAKAHVARTAQLQVMDERLDEVDNTIAQMQSTGASGADVGDIEIQRATLLDNALANMTYERAQRLAALETLRARYRPTHRQVVNAELELGAIEGAIAERLDQIATLGKAGALTGGQGTDSIEELGRVRDRVLTRRASVRAEAEALNERLVSLRAIDEERTRLRDLIDETRRALDEVIVESSNDLSGTVELIARGALPERPIEDKRKPMALGGALFGALAAFAAFVITALLRAELRFSDDLPAGCELAATIAQAPTSGALEGILATAGVTLRDALDLQGLPADPTIAVVGMDAGAGATTVAAALAASQARARGRTLLLDAAAIERAVAEGLRTESTDRGVIRLMASDTAEHDAERAPVTLDALRSLLADARAAAHCTVLDAGLVRPGTPAALGVALADAVVVVAAPGRSRRALETLLTQLARHRDAGTVTVFNQATGRDPGLST